MDKKEKKKTKNGHVLKKWGMDFNIVCKKYNKFVIFKFFFLNINFKSYKIMPIKQWKSCQMKYFIEMKIIKMLDLSKEKKRKKKKNKLSIWVVNNLAYSMCK